LSLIIPDGYARDYGGSGEPLVLVGEILAGAAAWRPHAEALTQRWRVTVTSPLLTIHAGRGERPPEPWSIAAEADVLAAYLDACGLGRVHLGGWSLGGGIAMELAMAHPERVRSLTLVEPQVWWVMRGLHNEPPEYAGVMERYRRFVVDDVDEATLAEFLWEVGGLARDEDPREQRGWRLAYENRGAIPYAWTIINTEEDIARVASLTMPVLLSRGEGARPFDVAMTDGLAGLIPHAERLFLPGAHTSHIEHAEAFVARLAAFLEAS
jgi:pimeloyl-ACP methyl ester carboxylesterase